MAEIELTDDSLVGVLIRTRIRQFEEKHSGASVYASNIRGVWEIRFTYGKGKDKHGTAYVSVPEATGWIARMHWPVGGKADITKLDYQNTAGLEGLILAALNYEEGQT